MEYESVRDWIVGMKAGDATAARSLFEAYAPRLYGYFYRATRDHHQAEDLLGETMLRISSTIHRYDESGRFEQWLFRIAANLVRDRIRRFKTRPTPVSLSPDKDSDDTPLSARIADKSVTPDDRMIKTERARQLNEALEQLDDTTRQMILLRHFGQMSFKAIAKTFDCPLGTALARVHRGIKQLRGLLESKDMQ
jgi:RNA polymerase sigma factor (sigma-70 family)